MKNLFIVAFLFLLISCNRNILKDQDTVMPKLAYQVDLQEAKKWLRTQNPSASAKQGAEPVIDADWSQVMGNEYYLEVPLMIDNKSRSSFLANESGDEVELNANKPLTRLMINRIGEEYIGRILEISPTKAYYNAHREVIDNGLLTSQNLKQYNFTGALIFYDIKYKFKSLIQVINGRGVNPDENPNIYTSDANGKMSAAKSMCFNYYRDTYERECIGTTCTEWVLVSHTFLYGYCAPPTTGTGGGGGGAGGPYPDPVNGFDVASTDGPVPRNQNTMFSALQKLVCSGGIPNGVTINYNFEPSYLTAQAGILNETGDMLNLADGRQASAITKNISGEGVQIWLSQDAFNKGELYLAAVIGHELVHAKHNKDRNGNIDNSASEYAAYQWTIDFLDRHNTVVKGDPILKRLRATSVTRRNSYTPQPGYDKEPCF